MLLTTPTLTLDPLWRLTTQCAQDTRPNRMNLVVGVYRDRHGHSPVQRAVLAAEERLVERAASKEYTGPTGNQAFNARVTELILGKGIPTERATTIQSVGGTGALRLLAELLAVTGPDRTVHLGTPAYVNHPAILAAAGLAVREYPVSRDGAFFAEGVLTAARAAKAGDVFLLQGSCHNPTGVNMPLAVWEELAIICRDRSLTPFIDHAYFGLGDGIDADLAGMRHLLTVVPEAVVAVSASKAWGLYNERTGCAIVLSHDPQRLEYARGVLEVIARAAYSQAPSHGASVVAEILGDPALAQDWLAELEEIRLRLLSLREQLVAALLSGTADPAFHSLREQRGMFLRLPLTPAQMHYLTTEHAIYGVPSGRINIAGIPEDGVARLADAILDAATQPRADTEDRVAPED